MRKSMMAAIFAGALFSVAAQAAEPEVLVTQGVRNQVQAVVQSIDLVNRDMTVKMPDGEVIDFRAVDNRVTHFENVKVNDKINVAGSESVSIALSKGTAGLRRVITSEGKDVTADGVGVLKTRATYNDLVSVDREKKLAKVKSPDGVVIEVSVPNDEVLSKAATGDQVIVYSRATLTVWGNYTY
ncbi:hypothetical protein NT239_16180 [Chitinibacter sp. SCUT-21]|uniref:hypothetical protein n=1 Tax=Chitinibacter sp. SCUT-21 TaxID=2970891 RepID=UPI0035A62419